MSVYRITAGHLPPQRQIKRRRFSASKDVKTARTAAVKTAENEYQPLSADGRPVEDKKGLNLLAGYKLTAITKTISKQTDTTYQVTTESLFDTAKVNRSLDFFKGKKYPPPRRKQVKQLYTQFRIETAPSA